MAIKFVKKKEEEEIKETPKSGKALVIEKKKEKKYQDDSSPRVANVTYRDSRMTVLESGTIPVNKNDREKSSAFSFMSIIAMAVLFLLSLASFSVAMTTVTDISNSAISSRIVDTIKKEEKGYIYGRLTQSSIVFNYQNFRRAMDITQMVSYSETFLHTQPDEEYSPFVTTNASYSSQLSPHIVMDYTLDMSNNYYNFSLVSGEPIQHIWTGNVYITEGFADELLSVDAELKASFDAKVAAGENGYLALKNYEIYGNRYYPERTSAVLGVADVITSSSLGHFSNINGGSFIYCSNDAHTWCFGKSSLEFFIYGNNIGVASYLGALDRGIASYQSGTFSLDFYTSEDGQLVRSDLTDEYLMTKSYYASGDGRMFTIIFASLGLAFLLAFNLLLVFAFPKGNLFLKIGPYTPIFIFLLTGLALACLLLMPNIMYNGVIFNFGNYLSIAFSFAIGFIESFVLAFIVGVMLDRNKKKISDEKNAVKVKGGAL